MQPKKVKLPSGELRWEVYFRASDISKSRIRRRFKKKIDAQRFINDFMSRGNSNKEDLKNTVFETTTFNQEKEYWLTNKASNFSDGYLRVIDPCLKKIDKYLGRKKISSFSPTLFFELRKALQSEGLKVSTQNRYLEIVVRILNFSFKHGRININPANLYEKVTECSDDIDFWSYFEVKTFLEFASNKYPQNHSDRWKYVVYLIALEAGLRANEIWGLTDDSINESTLYISKQLSKKKSFIPPKGKKPRNTPLSTNLGRELFLVKEDSHIKNKAHKTLFTNSFGNPVDHDNFVKRVFKKDLEESNLRRIRFHDLRHTAVTLMVNKNIPVPLIQKIVGHKDIQTTMRYVHILGKDIEKVSSIISLA